MSGTENSEDKLNAPSVEISANQSNVIEGAEGRTPLMLAILEKDIEKVSKLLTETVDVNAKDNDGKTALTHLININLDDDGSIIPTIPKEKQQIQQLVSELIKKGAEVDVPDNQGLTPLMHAVSKKLESPFNGLTKETWQNFSEEQKLNENLVTQLKKAGADFNAKDNEGRTPIMHAVKAGNKENSEILIEGGAEVDLKDNKGKTALIIAAEVGTQAARTITTLIKNGANVDEKDAFGKKAIDYARNEKSQAFGVDVKAELEFRISQRDTANQAKEEYNKKEVLLKAQASEQTSSKDISNDSQKKREPVKESFGSLMIKSIKGFGNSIKNFVAGTDKEDTKIIPKEKPFEQKYNEYVSSKRFSSTEQYSQAENKVIAAALKDSKEKNISNPEPSQDDQKQSNAVTSDKSKKESKSQTPSTSQRDVSSNSSFQNKKTKVINDLPSPRDNPDHRKVTNEKTSISKERTESKQSDRDVVSDTAAAFRTTLTRPPKRASSSPTAEPTETPARFSRPPKPHSR